MRHLYYKYPNIFGLSKRTRWDWFGGEDEVTTQEQVSKPEWYQAPDYAEATGARQNWWQTLQDWQKGGAYGAQLPNFEDVYKNAAKRISEYYWGGASTPGLMDRISARAARRGVAESPAIDVLKQRAGVEEAGQLRDVSTQLDVTKAQAIERARTNWLQSIMNLSGMKPAGTWGSTTTQTTTQPGIDYLPSIIGGGVQLLGNQMSNQWMSSMLNSKTTPSSLTQDYSRLGVSEEPEWKKYAGR